MAFINKNVDAKIPSVDVAKLYQENLLSGLGAKVVAYQQFMQAQKFHYALEVAIEIVNMLLKNGVEINAQNEEGRTALMYAVSEGSKELTEILIKNGANVNLKDINGDTALIIAIGNENEEISELLIKSGANTNDKNLEGKKLLEMTESSAFRKKLIKLGVKW